MRFLQGLLFGKCNKGDGMISALDDILEDFSVYLRVEKRISEGVTRDYCYSLGKFLRCAGTLNPEKRHAMGYFFNDKIKEISERYKKKKFGMVIRMDSRHGFRFAREVDSVTFND